MPRSYRSPDRHSTRSRCSASKSGYVERARNPPNKVATPWRMRQEPHVLDVATTLRTDLGKHLRGTPKRSAARV